jgi:hypothetical protein
MDVRRWNLCQLSWYGIVFSLLSRAHLLTTPFQISDIDPYNQKPSRHPGLQVRRSVRMQIHRKPRLVRPLNHLANTMSTTRPTFAAMAGEEKIKHESLEQYLNQHGSCGIGPGE